MEAADGEADDGGQREQIPLTCVECDAVVALCSKFLVYVDQVHGHGIPGCCERCSGSSPRTFRKQRKKAWDLHRLKGGFKFDTKRDQNYKRAICVIGERFNHLPKKDVRALAHEAHGGGQDDTPEKLEEFISLKQSPGPNGEEPP